MCTVTVTVCTVATETAYRAGKGQCYAGKGHSSRVGLFYLHQRLDGPCATVILKSVSELE